MVIYFKPDKRIFVLFAALQLSNVGLYKSLNNKQLSNLTIKLRTYFKYVQISSLRKLDKYFKKAHPYFLSQWILNHGNPPLFKKITKEWQIEAPLKTFNGFNQELGNFYTETKIEKLFWNNYKQEASVLKAKYLTKSSKIFNELRRYLKTRKRFSKVIILPNPFDAVGSGYGIEINNVNYVIFSPVNKRVDFDFIIHEFLHSLVEIDERKKINNKIMKRLTISNQAATHYRNKRVILTEYLIRTITGKFSCETQKSFQNYVNTQIKIGFINIAYFLKILGEYEKQQQLTFSDYINKILM